MTEANERARAERESGEQRETKTAAPSPPPVVRRVADLRDATAGFRADGERIALVPTMGALHAGHLSLITHAARHAERIIVTIFVNPTQFAEGEDLDAYPRTEADDLAKLARLPVDLVYAPSPREMYPDRFATSVSVTGLTDGLCGTSRPHFFGGVATVVCKLFTQARPDIAVFGEKDFQQLLVIRRMARDLDLGVEVFGAPIVRENDGLALSSRNAYLDEKARATAPKLHALSVHARNLIVDGHAVPKVLAGLRSRLTEAGFAVDYAEVRHAETLSPLDIVGDAPARLFVAAVLGETRLIDNLPIERQRGWADQAPAHEPR
ncbi:MAG: pantoate--beta-alanine ligase [Pseudomonadota bacterium]